MGDHLTYHRYQWFDGQVKKGRYPNASTLAEQFEISKKTAQRCIDSFRDRLLAPLEYDSSQKGYYYLDSNFQLPAPEITQEELLAILVAQNILPSSAGGVISNQIQSCGRKLFGASGLLGLSFERLNNSFSSTWNEYAPTQGPVFKLAMKGLLDTRLIEFTYLSPKSTLACKRTVEPHHLQHYMGNWIMVGYCHLRDDWRKFMLSRMDGVRLLDRRFELRPRNQWQQQLEGGFGIFQGGVKQIIKLKFNPFRAPWIREQVWHEEQSIDLLPDGGLLLSFPACHLHEVKMKVMQFGADVEVVEPEELRDSVSKEILKLQRLYEK